MPIYEYQCTACQHRMELIQKISDPVQTLCPQCSKETLVKLISAAGFQLKGTGWYATDFKNKPEPQTSKAPEQGTKAATAETSSSTEAAPKASAPKGETS